MKFIRMVERFVVYALIGMLLIGVVLGTVHLGYELVDGMAHTPFLLVEPETFFHSLAHFLMIVIGLELIRLLGLHLVHHKLRAQLVIEIAIIAFCNKLVTLEPHDVSGEILVGLATVLLALAASYFVFTRSRHEADSATLDAGRQ